jgi:hypothetical protein
LQANEMKFGNISEFAIEADLIGIHSKWIYGHLRFYVAGKPIGDFEDSSDLATSARWGRDFLRASPRRTRSDLDEVSTSAVFDLLYGRYVVSMRADPGAAQPPQHAPATEAWDRDPYLLDEVGESALRDKHALVVVRRRDGADRVIVRDYDGDGLFESLVTAGCVDTVVGEYCTWVERLAQGPEAPSSAPSG